MIGLKFKRIGLYISTSTSVIDYGDVSRTQRGGWNITLKHQFCSSYLALALHPQEISLEVYAEGLNQKAETRSCLISATVETKSDLARKTSLLHISEGVQGEKSQSLD